MGLLDRLAPRRSDTEPPGSQGASVGDQVFPTRALPKFLDCLELREQPVLLDLGPVVGSNVNFFGEQLGCKIFVENVFADFDRHVREGRLEALPEFLSKRFPQADASFDGILCWDLCDYLDRLAAQELANQLIRLLRPDGALLGFFAHGVATAQANDAKYTKYIVVDKETLRHKPYPAARGRHGTMANRDITRMFSGLTVSDSFLLQHNLREWLFRKPA